MKELDAQGYRPNVGMVVCNHKNELLWAKRTGMEAWQFPQGGIHPGEELEEAMYRELEEELGLHPDDVSVLTQTQDWVHYQFSGLRANEWGDKYIGQKQIWFLLRLISDENRIQLQHSADPEFDAWRWVDFEVPEREVVIFKKAVYTEILAYFRSFLFPERGANA